MFAMSKLHMTREDSVWNSPLSYILLLMREKLFRDTGKGIQLSTIEKIDSGEI